MLCICEYNVLYALLNTMYYLSCVRHKCVFHINVSLKVPQTNATTSTYIFKHLSIINVLKCSFRIFLIPIHSKKLNQQFRRYEILPNKLMEKPASLFLVFK